MIRSLVVKGLRLLLILGAISSIGLASEQPMIELREFAEVTTKDIFLKDVAKVVASGMEEELEAINLGLAPLEGSSRRLSLGQIEVRMRQAGFNPRDFAMEGAKEVWVTTTTVSVPEPHENPELKQESEVSMADDKPESSQGSSSSQYLDNNNNNTYQVVVPTRNIGRHELIDEADLVIEEREGRTIPSNLASIDYLRGKRATRLLVAGYQITESGAEIPPVIDRGDTVMIIASSGAVQVSVKGEARAAGGLGEVIPVENSSSNQVVYGTIVNSEIVQVEIGGLR